MIIFIVYILGSTLTGICTFGARIFVFKKYVVETKRTRPVALVFGVGYLVFCSFCLALQLLTLFPRYAAFGSQTYTVQDNTGASVEHYCDFKADPSVCQLSQLATFFMFVFGTNQSFLGVIFYYVNWIFFVLWLVGIVLSVIMTVRRNKQDATLISSMEYDADIERQKTPINGGSNSKSKSKSNNNRSYGTKVDVA